MSRPCALITGASRGIGRAVALRLSADYDIVALARSRAELESLAAPLGAAGASLRVVAVDLRDPGAVRDALTDIHCDALVNNAGVMVKKPLIDLEPDEWQAMIDVNLNAVFHVTRAVLPAMISRGAGHIVNIASIAGRSAFVGGSCYAATKHAVLGLTESLMLEVRDYGVRVSAVMPGSVATELTPGGSQKTWALRPEDVAECVAGILDAPAHALVYNVEVRAARPGKAS